MPFDPKKTVVAICTPVRDMLHMDTHRSIVRLQREFDGVRIGLHTLDLRDRPIDEARNEIVGKMLFDPACAEITHLLWIDDDMAFPPDALVRLLQHDLPIVGGLCHNRRHPYMPILLYRALDGIDGNHPYRYRYDYPKGLVKVDATGAAFILVRRQVYEDIETAFPTPGEGPYSNRGNGEDVSFCERAKACGYDTYVDTSLDISHIGEIHVNEEFARRNRMSEFNPWVPPRETPLEGKPRASIIINTYNQKPEYLRAAIMSALQQTVPVEVIVVDDGSDGALEATETRPWALSAIVPLMEEIFGPAGAVWPHAGRVLLFPPKGAAAVVQLVTVPHAGCYPALNAGIERMTTDWFAWLSSDDLHYPKKTERQLRALAANVALACFSGYTSQSPTGDSLVVPAVTWRTLEEQQRVLSQGCAFNGLTAMIHRSILEVIRLPNGDYFDTSLDICADWDLWNRVAQLTFWLPMPEILATRREHGENDSVRFANDPVKRERWIAQDALIRERYRPRCRSCGAVP